MAADRKSGEAQHAWDMMKSITFAMLATRDGDAIRSRPMAAYVEPQNNAVLFLTDVRRHKDDEIARDHHVNLAFADTSGQKYVSVSGTAAISNDRAIIKELFTTAAKAWWDSAEDPNIRVLKITPDEAEYWDSPGTIVSYVKMAMAAATGSRPDLGENRKVAI
ncbi:MULTISPECIES: pyridoxamine 5'-phosphate oxidase family protein [Rhodopseudomonas]|uniref:General stress protein n=1 Tax=Rhodopseudomonas palustris TaxID=1076 RepID=A0A0D7E3M2_RHOPL|nr:MULTISPECIES: pyridoxamine 5'-phosphate oxidase family protein [Rhodopseudomonas]KIZ35443.1 general stress protein [Rhodopseudomonas palustris]MDF3810789.1 pyridoxamine 5'-phosphate oxidase family protein [Rhodopseudomonas sp. BAL398]WOK16318.1 pyridoxamine 5'-phosphate oxidase family protein [Rhodopseudomonas sp. BAL398]